MTSGQPAWAAFYIDWMHPVSLALALVMPCLRALIRKWRRRQKGFVLTYVLHDVASGLVLPSFFALCLTAIIPDMLNYADKHSLILAGFLGIVYTFAELFSTGDPPH